MVHSQVQVPPELEGKRRSEQYSSSEYASDTDGEPGGDHIHLLKEYDSSLEMMAMGGMWMCGILNNFGYVILNTAAETIFPGKAGLVLFFNIVPGLLVKMAVPFFAHLLSYRAKVILVTFGALISMLIVAGTDVPELKCLGIAMMSMSSCFGEVCFLAMSFNFPDKSITYWSSGTGVSGVFGSAMFILMTRVFGFSARTTLVIGAFLFVFYYVSFAMLVEPLLNGILASSDMSTRMLTRSESSSGHYQRMNCIASEGNSLNQTHSSNSNSNSNSNSINEYAPVDADADADAEAWDMKMASSSSSSPIALSGHTSIDVSNGTAVSQKPVTEMSLAEQLQLIGTLKHFMIPLFWVYLGEYVINTGINPTISFTTMTHGEFFEYASLLYQVGVFFSRSSRSYIAIHQLYWFPVLQMSNVFLFLAQSYFGLIDSPTLWLTLVLWEGLLGGGTYVNAFHQVKTETPRLHAEWALGVVSLSDSFGIVLAAVVSIYLECWLGRHNNIGDIIANC